MEGRGGGGGREGGREGEREGEVNTERVTSPHIYKTTSM